MTKDKHIILRVTEEDKHRIQEAAQRAGMSMTSFVVEAALGAISSTEPATAQSLQRTASGGGAWSYRKVACRLAQLGVSQSSLPPRRRSGFLRGLKG